MNKNDLILRFCLCNVYGRFLPGTYRKEARLNNTFLNGTSTKSELEGEDKTEVNE